MEVSPFCNILVHRRGWKLAPKNFDERKLLMNYAQRYFYCNFHFSPAFTENYIIYGDALRVQNNAIIMHF